MKIKAFFIILKGLPLAKNYLRHESAPLIIVAKFLKNILKLLTGLQFDICSVVKIKLGFKIAEIARF